MILVSCEGTIMAYLTYLSAANRALIYEVRDLKGEEATAYVMNEGATKKMADKAVESVGGRSVDLHSCWKVIEYRGIDCGKTDDL